jgi:hypothetical protein
MEGKMNRINNSKCLLDTNSQITKLNRAYDIAEDASKSAEIDRRLGAFLLYAGFVDFSAIQAARLIEQIILKGQLANGSAPSFQPHDDSYFYNNQVSTRKILKGIRAYLPFHSSDPDEEENANQINELTKKMVKLGLKFLGYRNTIVHHIGNPAKTFEDIIVLCDEAIKIYEDFQKAHAAFTIAAQPYRFSEKELDYFYGDRNGP